MPSPSARRSNIASDVAWRMPRSKSLTCGCGIPRSTPMSVWLAPVHRRKMVITAPMSRAAGRAHVLPVPEPRRRDRVGTLSSGHLKPARRTRADRHAWYTSAGLDPLAMACIVLGMHSRATITDRSAAHQPAVDRGEQFTPGGVETRIGTNSVEHAADGLSGRRGVPEQAGERIGLQVEELLKLLDRRRVRCPAALLPLPYGRWRAVDGSRHGALGKTSVFAGLAQGASEGLALGASAVHRPSMPDGLVGSPEDPSPCKEDLVSEARIFFILKKHRGGEAPSDP